MFLDDERFPKTDRDWILARSFKDAIYYMERKGCPSYISFDNDLGEGKFEGIHLAHWMVEKDMNENQTFFPPDFDFNVHSANTQAGPRIESLLRQYLTYRKQLLHPEDPK
jgi:hypothetical protein